MVDARASPERLSFHNRENAREIQSDHDRLHRHESFCVARRARGHRRRRSGRCVPRPRDDDSTSVFCNASRTLWGRSSARCDGPDRDPLCCSLPCAHGSARIGSRDVCARAIGSPLGARACPNDPRMGSDARSSIARRGAGGFGDGRIHRVRGCADTSTDLVITNVTRDADDHRQTRHHRCRAAASGWLR